MTSATATVYELPPIVTVSGTFTLYVYSDNDALTAPTIQTILNLGDLTEKANVSVGVSEIGNMTISVREDHSVDAAGFWFLALQGECWINLTLDEGAGETSYFFGIVDKALVQWDEQAIVGSARIRTANLTILSMAGKLFELSMDDFVAEVITKKTFIDDPLLDEPSHVIKLTEMFACMLVASGVNVDYPGGGNPVDSDIELVYGTQVEMDFGEGIGHYRADEIYLPVQYYDTLAPEAYALCQYFDTSGTNCLSRQSDGTGYYNNLKSFLVDLLANFGLIMRMDYDLVNSRHLIKLMYRHDVYSDVLTFGGREKESTITFSTAYIGDAARATSLTSDTEFIWQSKRYGRFPNPTAPDGRIQFDIDLKCVFIVTGTPTSGLANNSIIIWSGVPTEAFVYATGVRFYSTVTGLMSDAMSSDPLKMHEAACAYQYERFTAAFTTIRHTYARMEATSGASTSHSFLNIMRRREINNLSTTENYFANIVTKKPMTGEVAIEWQEED